MQRRFAQFFILCSLMLGLLVPMHQASAQSSYTHDIIVYGGGFGGIAAALNAQQSYKDLHGGTSGRVLLINAQSVVGGLGTLNGQNFWDWKTWNGAQPQAGNHAKFIIGNGTSSNPQFDQFYSTSEMASWLQSQLDAKGITTLKPYDVKTVSRDSSGRITSISVQKLKRENQAWVFDTSVSASTYTAPVFIDASENGRLTRLSGITTTTGRESRNSDKRQMVATLMFKAKGINRFQVSSEWGVVTDKNGTVGMWGGANQINAANNINIYTADPATTPLYWLAYFNKMNSRFQIKAMNIAEDRYSYAASPSSETQREYWINALLVVNVDGKCERKDGCPEMYTDQNGDEAWSTDFAFSQAREAIGSNEFKWAMQSFPGFSQFQVMTINVAGTNYPIVGEQLYLRETIHTPSTTVSPDDNDYAITGYEVNKAGYSPSTGADTGNYANRIGLGYYWMDSNGYTKSNPSSGNLDADPIPWSPQHPANPVYIPVEALLTSQAPNLIVAGYSANISPWAWTMMRVLPNLTVMGDAAGVLAAYAVSYATDPINFPAQSGWMTNVRNRIALYGGRVNK